jgi:hypothetical protein
MTRTASNHLLDMLAEVPDPCKKKRGSPPPVSLDARTHGCRTPMWLTQLYTDCQMNTLPLRPAKRLGVYCETNPGGINVSLSLSTSGHHRCRPDSHAVDNTDLSGVATFTSGLRSIVMDGKTLGNSETRNTHRTHLLSAVSHELGIAW